MGQTNCCLKDQAKHIFLPLQVVQHPGAGELSTNSRNQNFTPPELEQDSNNIISSFIKQMKSHDDLVVDHVQIPQTSKRNRVCSQSQTDPITTNKRFSPHVPNSSTNLHTSKNIQLKKQAPLEESMFTKSPELAGSSHNPHLHRDMRSDEKHRILTLSKSLLRKKCLVQNRRTDFIEKQPIDYIQSELSKSFIQNTNGLNLASNLIGLHFEELSESSIVFDSKDNTAGRPPSAVPSGCLKKKYDAIANHKLSNHTREFLFIESD